MPLLRRVFFILTAAVTAALVLESQAFAGEAELVLPKLDQVTFFGNLDGRSLLMLGLVVAALGLVFALVIFRRLRSMAVHSSMLEISELIYETCKTYLGTQVKFILILEVLIGSAIAIYYGVLQGTEPYRVAIILLFSLIGIAGSVSVAWFGIRVNTFANSRTAFASLRGKPYPCYDIPLQAGA